MEPHLDILLVDDDHADMALFGIAVDKSDLKIWLQNLPSGQDAVEYLTGRGAFNDRSLHPLPDVIVLDLAMPQMDGFEFLAWRKFSPAFAAIPIVVLSGSKVPDEAERVIAAGADKFIVKPNDFEDWKRVVREIWDFGTRRTILDRADQADGSRNQG